MSDDAVEDVKARVEGVVSAKMEELCERISEILSGCSKEANVREESDALKTLLCGIEMRFREEHRALVEAINAHTTATKAQTSLLEELCNEAKTMNEKMDPICTHATRLENVERYVETITNGVQGVEEKTDVVSSNVLSLNERVDDISLSLNMEPTKLRQFRRLDHHFEGRS